MINTENQTPIELIRLGLKSDKKNRFCLYYLVFLKRGLSLESTILISKLIEWYGKQSDKKNNLIYKTINEMQMETGLSRYKQDKAINTLRYCQLITVVNKGIPRKRHFLVDFNALAAFTFGNHRLDKNRSSLFGMSITECKPFTD